MTLHRTAVGIDVSKDRLDIFDGQPSSCANRLEAITPLARAWAERGVLVVLEATGAYDRTLRRALDAAGVTYARVNPGRARDVARAAGFLAKTDQVDARMLSALGRVLEPRAAEPLQPGREKLTALHRRRDQMVHVRQQERTRLKGCDEAEIAQHIERHFAWLDQEIVALDGRIAQAIGAEPSLATDRRLLGSIPGVGPVAAATLLTLVPELGARSGKAIAALAGLAPLNRDSGQHRGSAPSAGDASACATRSTWRRCRLAAPRAASPSATDT